MKTARLTYVLDFGILHDILVHGDGRDPEQHTSDDHGDDTWDPPQNTREM